MATLTLFIWALLTLPSDRMVCSMWLPKAPTQAVMNSAGCWWTKAEAADYVWRAIELETGRVVCQRPASELPVLTCDIWPLDHYLLRVYQPGYRQQYCLAVVTYSGPPSAEDLQAQCPADAPGALGYGKAAWQFVASGPAPLPTLPAQICPMPELDANELPPSPDYLGTENDYQLLAYQLKWQYGQDYDTIAWQNQFDAEIYAAGHAAHVPPGVLKGMFAVESQFWPLWAPERKHGFEVGLGQLTDDGADLALRYSPELYASICPIATIYCSKGYDYLPAASKQMMRDILRGRLIVSGTPRQAAQQAAATIPTWARILAVYYCAAGEIVHPAGVDPNWEYALAAYHSGLECVRGGEICKAGRDYLRKVMTK
jgi:hypothetical protein